MAINSLWFKWKSMKLPWRKSFLAGVDLNGNTFWEFKDAINTGRMRRIVKADPQMHHADLKVSPQWLQWLRHTRSDAPTIEEQKADLIRQAQLKQLARIADAKWTAKKSPVEAPILTEAQRRQLESIKGGQTQAQSQDSEQRRQRRNGDTYETAHHQTATSRAEEANEEPEIMLRGHKVENPFAKNKPSGPSENWQPEAWMPAPRRK